MALKHLPDLLDFAEFEDANQMLVCVMLYYRADRRGLIRGSQNDVAEDCHLSLRTVTRVMRRLLELGQLVYFGHGRYALPGKEAAAPKANGANKPLTPAESVLAYIRENWDGEPKMITVLADDPPPEWVTQGQVLKILSCVGPDEIKGEPAWAYKVHWPSS